MSNPESELTSYLVDRDGNLWSKDTSPPYLIGLLNGDVSQFTGLHDSAGVEIYEGDIVRSERSKALHLVEWAGEYPGWLSLYIYEGEDDQVVRARNVTVLGNRWENPKLAEGCE